MSSRITKLNFNSTQLNFNLDNFLDNENALLTFNLLGLLIWALQLVLSEARPHTCEPKIFGLLVAQVVQKVYDKTGPFSHILYSAFELSADIDHADQSRCNKLFVQGCRSSRTRQYWQKHARMPPNFVWSWPKVDFRKAKVPLYRNERKSGLNWPWLERVVCWKRQEVSKHTNYTLGWSLPGTSCSCFKIKISEPLT